jgi:hypothetical protein
MLRIEKSEYSAAQSSPKAMPRRNWMSMLKINKIPAMAMKLSRMFFHWIRLWFTSGSNRVVKKHDVATQATPMDTFEACILAKKATQCKASKIPHPLIFITAFQLV